MARVREWETGWMRKNVSEVSALENVEYNYFRNAGVFVWNITTISHAIRTLLPLDEDGNAKVGKDIRLYDCKNSVVHAADESKVVVQGLDGYIVAEKHGQLLVCSLKEEQRIKKFGK